MARPLNSRQIEAFRAVILTGGMTAGGRLLSISQPAVSRLIQDLEIDLGLVLFNRQGAHITPTPQGLALFREVERHFIGTERIRDAAAAIRQHQAGHLRVAAILSLSLNCIPRVAKRFLAAVPGATLSLHSAPALEIVELMRGGGYDLGLAPVAGARGDVRHEAFPDSEVVCLLPTGHALAARPSIGPGDLDGQDLIALGSSSLMRLQLEVMLKAAGVRPRIVLDSLYSATVANCVAQRLGLAVTDPLAALAADAARVVVKPFRPGIPYRISAIFPPDDPPSTLALRFAEVFGEVFAGDVRAAAERAGMEDHRIG
ncbi:MULTISPECIES: LysR substrate-binding domain-containing protein [Roseomonadaceae]|uniref:LysR family transcriptional regulator n=1 Tax=Falsiroseomonas oleicola TaxID=2801474 RepID=A0ABS6H9P5_9PROT|nr:LysR substrate-binding domain-containing protein [Roseomonas oleicola]MBU8544542.1 LysR family transcriptional regulator [Roseomonas oleicola]